MSSRSGYIPVPELFAAQFTPAGDGFVYRKSSVGEAKQVTLAERDRFVAAFTYRRQYLTAAAVAGIVMLVFVVAMQPQDAELAPFAYRFALGLFAIFWLVQWAIWRAPARELAGRQAIAAALSRHEARRLRFSRLTYGQLLFWFVWGVSIMIRDYGRHDAVSHGWGMLWLAVPLAFMLFILSQTYGKWRTERAG